MRTLNLRILCLFTGLLLSFFCYAQQAVILSGNFTTPNGERVTAGTAFLLKSTDSSIVKVALVTESQFRFDAVAPGTYLLKVSCSGYLEDTRTLDLTADQVLTINLQIQARTLNEVQVVGSRKLFSVNNGNIKINIDNPVFLSIPSPVNLMSKLPGIQLSPDGESISVIGKGAPLIYLDNQRITMNDLKSLSVEEIKSIEIINNPSARYEAEGRVVLQITRKFNKREGVKVDLSQTLAHKRFRHSWSRADLSFKKKKLELKANVQYNYLNLWESNSNDFRIVNQNISSDYTVRATGPRKQLIFGGGMYYQVNESDYLSLSANTLFHNEPFGIATKSNLRQGTTSTSAVTNTRNESKRPYFNSNINYNKKLPAIKGNLFMGAQYSNFTRELGSAIYNSINNTPEVYSQNRFQDFNIEVVSGRIDFEKQFKNNISVEVGSSVVAARASALLDIQGFDPPEASKTNYDYEEDITALYGQLSAKLGKADLRAGLRMENTRAEGKFKTSPSLLIDRDNAQFFPRVNLSFPLDSTKSMTLSFARSISRPNYSNISQIVTYINPFFEWSSNVNLVPTTTNELSATLQFGNNSLQVTGYTRKNPVYYSASYNSGNGRFLVIDENFDRERGINVTLTMPFTVKKWNSTNSITGNLNKTTDPDAGGDLKTTPFIYFYSGNQLALPKSYNLFSNLWIVTSRYEGIFKRNTIGSLDVGGTKTFRSGLTLSLTFNDIFRSINFREELNINNVSSNVIYYDDGREVSLNIRYSFGSIKNAAYKNKDVNDNMNRLR